MERDYVRCQFEQGLGEPHNDGFSGTAESLGIPHEHRENPVVYQFIGIVHRLEELRAEVDRASLETSRPSVAPYPNMERSQACADLDGIEPRLSDRYMPVELLLRVAGSMLIDGLQGRTPLADNATYLQHKLNAAIGRYGLRVVTEDRHQST